MTDLAVIRQTHLVRALVTALCAPIAAGACWGVGGSGGPVYDQIDRVHYRVVNHVSALTVRAAVEAQVLGDVWTTGHEKMYDSTGGRRYLGKAGWPCDVQFVRHADRDADVFLYEDSLFPVVNSVDHSFTPEALNLMGLFAIDPEDPIELTGKIVKVFVLPHLATRRSDGEIVPDIYLGWTGGTPQHAAFPAVYLDSRRIVNGGYWSAFTHEMSHILAPQPTWDDNYTDFTNILTWRGTTKWEWDDTLGQLVSRPATDQSVRTIIDVNGKSQCDAAWTLSYVRDLVDTLMQ